MIKNLCCLINPAWICDTCDWKGCDNCLETRALTGPDWFVTVDDMHSSDAHCRGRVQRP
jgi:hypothetical protein